MNLTIVKKKKIKDMSSHKSFLCTVLNAMSTLFIYSKEGDMKKVIIFLVSILYSSWVFAGSLKEIVFIGDSLSDNGNLYAVLKVVPKSPPYFKGRFTNGATWAENVGKYFYDKSYINTKIYAWGGATAILHNPLHDSFIAPITLDGEMYAYFLNTLFQNKSNVLYIIWIGANDYLYDRQPDMNALADSVVDKISWAVSALINQGAQNLMVLNLPNLSRTPFALSHHSGERLNALSLLHNQKLQQAMNNIRNQNPEVKIISLDVFNIFNELLDDTQKYNQRYGVNLTNRKDSCWKGGMTLNNIDQARLTADLQKAYTAKESAANNVNMTAMSHTILNSPALALAYATGKAQEDGLVPCDNANQYIFWDELHPTQIVHQILAQIVEQSLVENGVDI